MRNEFDALGFAATQRRADLAEFEVIEAGVAKGFESATNFRMGRKKIEGLRDTEVQDLRDVFSAPFDVERFAIEARALASLARHDGGREKVHFEFDRAGAFALRATALRAVEGKTARAVAAQAR